MAFASLLRAIGFLLLGLAVAHAAPILVALGLDEDDSVGAFGLSAGTALFFAVVLIIAGSGGRRQIGRREGVLLAVGGWTLLSLFASLPFVIGDTVASWSAAVLEATSGLTTTGLTVVADADAMARSVVMWRALLQWGGGFATILFASALAPHIGLMAASGRASGASQRRSDTSRPRLRQVAETVGISYLGLSLVCALALLASGMPLLDAVCYAMATVSTGGFVPNSGGPAAYGSAAVAVILMAFMIAGAVNFALHWTAAAGRPGCYARDPEAGFLVLLIALAAAAALILHAGGDEPGFGLAARRALFDVISAVTTTGYAQPGSASTPIALLLILAGLVAVGGAAVSTSGGLKLLRMSLLLRQSGRELERLAHPHGVMLIKIGRLSVTDTAMQGIWAFFVMFVFFLILLSLALAAVGLEFGHALILALSALANCGPILTQAAGYGADLGALGDFGQLMVALGMLIGRLEVFALLVLLMPIFWQR